MFLIVFSSAVNIAAINYGVSCAIFIIVCTSHFSLCSPREDVCTRGIRREKRIWMDGPKINDSPRTFSWVDSFSLFFPFHQQELEMRKLLLLFALRARNRNRSNSRHTPTVEGHWPQPRQIDLSKGTLASAKAYWALQRNIGLSKGTLASAMAHRPVQRHIGLNKGTLASAKAN